MIVDKEKLKEVIQTISKLYPNGEVNNTWNDEYEIKDSYVESVVSDCIEDIYYYGLGFCGCGTPENTLEVIRLILVAQQEIDWDNRMIGFNNICGLGERNRNYEALIDFVLYTLDDKGFLNHGSSIGGAWLTEKGQLFLYLLELNKLIDDENSNE